MAQKPRRDFIFRKNMSIGEVDAENDSRFLIDCFVDNGDLEILEDTTVPQCIILGRTGSGKSALIERLERQAENTIRIEPDELALKHISNSTVLGFFEEIGVNLDIFYSLLWQHTLAVELIKYKYEIDSPTARNKFLESIRSIISGNSKKQQALKYIEEWGDKFWLDTETRIKEFTEKLESSLKASIDSTIPNFNFSTGAGHSLTEEQRCEVKYYGKQVVDSVQIEKLAKIVNLLSEDIFTDPQRRVYILIDRLDENWVEDGLRYKLIRALIETIRKFKKIEPVKIIITLRTDLLDRVLEKTRDSGFQREKYNSLFLNVNWSKTKLTEAINLRINHLLKGKYTNSDVLFNDVFPSKIDKVTSEEYVIDRTLLRPRDVIVFINECFSEAQGKTEITPSIITSAEKAYSVGRLESLQYEWFVEHPNLGKYINILSHITNRFKVSELPKDELEALILDLANEYNESQDDVMKAAGEYINSAYPQTQNHLNQFIQCLIFTLYKVGAIGIKIDGTSAVAWIHNKTQAVSQASIKNTSIVYVHKMLWRALAINKSI